jgi:hypothetical protein
VRGTYNAEWLEDSESGLVIGINLGADYCAEHEFGIRGIHSALGVTFEDHIYGIDRRRVRQVPEHLEFGTMKIPGPDPKVKGERRKPRKAAYLLLRRPWASPVTDYKSLPSGLRLYGDQTLACAWDESEFGILATGDDIAKLEDFQKHLLEMDVAVGMGKQLNPFHRGGLVFTIISRLPQEVLNKVYEDDKDHHELLLAAKATGIEDYLKAAGKRYYALSPRWSDKEAGEIRFWLNPMDQHIYNHGWFTVNELKQWAANEGPIMKKTNVPK